MKKSKNHLSILLFLSLFLVLTNCQKDEDLNVNQNFKAQHSNFKVSHIGDTEINQNKQLSDKLNTLVEIVERGKTENSGKLIFSEADNFYIETDFATYIEDFDTNSHSYTFPITRIGETNGIENLLIVSQQDGSYKTFLIEYDFTPQEILDIENEVFVDITNKVNMYSLQEETLLNDIFNKTVVVEDCIRILMCPWSFDGLGEPHPAGQECIDANRTGEDALYYAFSGNCTGSGGGIANTNPTDTSNGPNYGGDTTVNSTSVTSLNPIKKRQKDFNIKLRQLNLTQCENVDNNLTSEEWEELYNYLESELQLVDPYGFSTTYPEEAESFAISAIEAICDGVDDDKVCLNSFEFTDIGANWQNAGVSNVNVQFLTIGSVINLANVHYPELHFGLPKILANGDYITNYNARYYAQEIMTQAESLTDTYFSINPNSTAIQLKSYLLEKLQEIAAETGGTVSTYEPNGWLGYLVEHQSYIISSGWECD